jgi:hypothetical protein
MTQHQGTMEWVPCVGPTPLCLGIVSLLCSVSVLIISQCRIYVLVYFVCMYCGLSGVLWNEVLEVGNVLRGDFRSESAIFAHCRRS